MTRDRELEGYILDGVARRLWVHAFMIWSTEVESPPQMSESWEERAPNTKGSRQASMQAAQALIELIVQGNRGLGQYPLAALFHRARQGHGPRRASASGSTTADRGYAFGEDLVNVCLGTMSIEDSMLRGLLEAVEKIGRRSFQPARTQLPLFKIKLDDDGQRLSWDGDLWPNSNPARGGARSNPCNPCGHTANPGNMADILLLEDDPALQRGTTRMLKRIFPGMEVVVVDNVDAAMAELASRNIGLIISDVDVVGDENGIDFFHMVEEQHPNLVDQFVFLTGNDAARGVHYRFVEKPASATDLRSAIMAPAPPRAAPEHQEIEEPSLEEVADAAKRAAKQIRQEQNANGQAKGRFARKVFLSAIWRILRQDPRFAQWQVPGNPDAVPPELADLLISAHQLQLLVMARADLVAAMDPNEVQASEITTPLGAQFHFLVDEEHQNPPRRRNPAVSQREYLISIDGRQEWIRPTQQALDALEPDEGESPADAAAATAKSRHPSAYVYPVLDPARGHKPMWRVAGS